MKRTAVVLVAGLLLLTGCMSAPSREDVSQRLDAELEAEFGTSADTDDLVDLLTGYAFDGDCGTDEIRDGLDGGVRVAWASTCLAYFQSDMSESQIEDAKKVVAPS